MYFLADCSGTLCLFLVLLVAFDAVESCSPTLHYSCTSTDEAEQAEQLDVLSAIQNHIGLTSVEPDDADIQCTGFTTEHDCDTNGCWWTSNGCVGDDAEVVDALLHDEDQADALSAIQNHIGLTLADTVDTDIECTGFTTEHDCDTNGCWWTSNGCVGDDAEVVDALLHDEDQEDALSAIQNHMGLTSTDTDDTDIECTGFTTEHDCDTNGCWWTSNGCVGDDAEVVDAFLQDEDQEDALSAIQNHIGLTLADPDDNDIECTGFTTEHDCDTNGCWWTSNGCVGDDAEVVDALLQDNVPVTTKGSIAAGAADPVMECRSFTTEHECDTNGCWWVNNRCVGDDAEVVDALSAIQKHIGLTTADPDATDIECTGFTTEHDCDTNGCWWTNNGCVGDEAEVVDALLQDNATVATQIAIAANFDDARN